MEAAVLFTAVTMLMCSMLESKVVRLLLRGLNSNYSISIPRIQY